jgi:hypothetical protein
MPPPILAEQKHTTVGELLDYRQWMYALRMYVLPM